MELSHEDLRRLINHIFLPPKLPQHEDNGSDIPFIEVTLQSLYSLRDQIFPTRRDSALDTAIALVAQMKAVHSLAGGNLDQECLKNSLANLSVGRTLAIKISAQNSAVLITRSKGALVFEMFELSPSNAAVLATRGRLLRNFPGLSVTLDVDILDRADWLDTMANTLSTMSSQKVAGVQPKSKKAGTQHQEERDTTKPGVVSEILFGFLRGSASAAATSVSSVWKRTRDDVLWNQAWAPWRRSPMWLLIRVALQLVLSRSENHILYKEIMVYTMGYVLKAARASQAHFDSDIIFTMTVKLSRRLQKLSAVGHGLPDVIRNTVQRVVRDSVDMLSRRWTAIQKHNGRHVDLITLEGLNFQRDTWVYLPALDAHLASIQNRKYEGVVTPYLPSSQLVKRSPDALPSLPSSFWEDEYDAVANLHSFERWITAHLDAWMATQEHSDAIEKLHALSQAYHKLASHHYGLNPEMSSVMLLTLFELWNAIDTMAVQLCPLLADFDPQIPAAELQSLLLPFAEQMRRLGRVESSLRSRSAAASKASSLLFDMTDRGFANVFFAQSSSHRALLEEIQVEAAAARRRKLVQFRETVAEYRRLDALHSQATCDYITRVLDDWCDPPEIERSHSRNCVKCSYASRRDKLAIHVHEWPLPSLMSHARAVVFELALPSWYGHWRDARSFLLQSVLRGERSPLRPHTSYRLGVNDPHLTQRHFRSLKHHRIGLLSQTKPCLNTHYGSKKIATLEETDVCQPNGLHYGYYDAISDTDMGDLVFTNHVARSCTYRLSREALRQFIFRPPSRPDGPRPNTAIAAQDQCPGDMTLEEYKELATLPLGRHLQWANILAQLAMTQVDFKKLDTILIFLQCIYQAGPPGDTDSYRESHTFMAKVANVSSLLEAATTALLRVKANWESAHAIELFVALVARMLSLSPTTSSQTSCFVFLDLARDTTMKWIRVLRDKACAAQTHDDRMVFTNKSVEIALICASTFDVDDYHVAGVLERHGSVLLQCSILIQEAECGLTGEASHEMISMLKLHYQRLLHRVYEVFTQDTMGGVLDHAVLQSWSGYLPSDFGWRVASAAVRHWVTTITAEAYGSIGMHVHLNLLTGELLVDGLPLNQPPKGYRETALYRCLFDRASVEVMPCTSPGFEFSTKQTFGHGYSLRIGLSSDELVVRASRNGLVYDTIPAHTITEYASHFVDDHVHWYDHQTGTIQFRPKSDPWNAASPDGWMLSKEGGGQRWQLSRAGALVAGVNSPTSRSIGHILEPLAHPARIHNVVRTEGTLHVDIPMLRLSFFLREGTSHLESSEFRAMAVDSNQSVGSLVGLKNKLLLKSTQECGPNAMRRSVLIPESALISYARESGHVAVNMTTDSIFAVHELEIDPLLGRLVDNGSCKLYVAYLHALTSFCLADPLTRRTGTEQALSLLKSAAVRSFDHLSQTQVDTLCRLAGLTPSRSYYPRHERVMQSVDWDGQLSFLSQHGHFLFAAREILDQATKASIFWSDQEPRPTWPKFDKTEDNLVVRDNLRCSTFRVSQFGAEDHTAEHDLEYSSRDHDPNSKRAASATAMSTFMSRSGTELCDALNPGCLYNELVLTDCINGPSSLQKPQNLTRYSGALLSDGPDGVRQNLPVLHRWLTSADAQNHKFSIVLWLCTLASAGKLNPCVLQVLGAFFKAPTLAQVKAPEALSFRPKMGGQCSYPALRKIIVPYRKPLSTCPENSLRRSKNEKLHVYQRRRDMAWQSASDSVLDSFLRSLMGQWPCEHPVTPDVSASSKYVDVAGAMRAVRDTFQKWHDNKCLFQYLDDVERISRVLGVRKVEVQSSTGNVSQAEITAIPRGYVSEQDLFAAGPDPLLRGAHRPKLAHMTRVACPARPHPRLSCLLESVRSRLSTSKFAKAYCADLEESMEALLERETWQIDSSPHLKELIAHFRRCQVYSDQIYGQLSAVVNARGDASCQIHLPRVSPILFLQQLSHRRWKHVSAQWKACIVQYGIALTTLQQARRLLTLSDPAARDDLVAELQNSGHRNWDPTEYPESLLIEVESGILIREVQEQIAGHIRSPPHGENAVMQLNMGEGKSTVIVPITASALADTRLVRVIVAKSQSKQMAQMLISKLGGLVDRRVYYLPISRSLRLGLHGTQTVGDMIRECKRTGGILLVQPEHILSMQLMALECFISDKHAIGAQLLSEDVQDIMSSAHDIVDEADENFDVRFELIYTMGTQSTIELSPDRWLLIQEVLEILRLVAPGVSREAPASLECHARGICGTFPRTRILRQDAETKLLHRLARCICDRGLSRLRIARQPAAIRIAIYNYITKPDLDQWEIASVERSIFWTESTASPLLLLRGLVAGGVLAFVFGSKRYRVNYGLTTVPRTPPSQLAVPYRAKDFPSSRSEFSHPDVVIALTCLSYYYGGLSDDDLFTSIGHVIGSDQADLEYQAFVQHSHELPAAFHDLRGINLKDRPQCIRELFPALRFAKNVIDYFLAHIVFPKEMKEFPLKLSASGWDLGKSKVRGGGAVTGFSGTNDSRRLLPLDVRELDLPEQKHTNALVLGYILQPENDVVLLDLSNDSALSEAERMLTLATTLEPAVEVILDCGAAVLELGNLEVAKTWLQMHSGAKSAVVFVNDRDEICIVDRTSRVELLRTSTYAGRLDSCLVFLDEAHTRGIDLKLPPHYRALVTLGAGVTKDRLVQACMRLRKLGKGQSVVFCVSSEIQAKILSVTGKSEPSSINIADVLLWSISETHSDVRRSMPLWQVQGQRFYRQQALWEECGGHMTVATAKKFQEQECQTIEHRYHPLQVDETPSHSCDISEAHLRRISARCQEFDDLEFTASTLQEEQERELSPEIEQERHVQRPPAASPARHQLRDDVIRFAKHGIYDPQSKAYMAAFAAFQGSSAAEMFSPALLKCKLLVSADFYETLDMSSHSHISDSYQRPVQWMLSNRVNGSSEADYMLVISPFEANQLYPEMKHSRGATLHMYKPKCNSGYATLDHLLLHTVPARDVPDIPRSLAVAVNLFAGQLYISSREDYLEICGFLGLSAIVVTQEMTDRGWRLDATGFILSDDAGRSGCGYPKSPVSFFKGMISKVRRNGEAIDKTHIGQLLDGRLFSEQDFDG
ncbi:hypothetical protein CB0940_12275 [Cercospora beticola]|uniref:ubiquitinyl hydrolase 1 n=1 Tax=Cercospora beticola TaxID=122368 RepID=A0A2G5GRK9_CERBT|nr:hypothetical protein CB0940_12275 [Cercospora beticola]PIA82927.1 hypothetical protein CB0940_12275 [Cercospora beticola]WPB03942.1 hypothetical protein RHO25_008586 [Cercospora beticola]